MIEEFKVISQAVPVEVCKMAAIEYEIQEAACHILYPNGQLSDLSPNSFARYSPLCFEALSVYLTPLLEKETGMKLYPVYSYARIYYHKSKLDKHIDRRSSEISVSVCIQKDETPWPLYIKTKDGVEHQFDLNVGDIVIYKGREQEHWRDEFQGQKQIQAFLQYVDANGKDSWLKWDTRPALGLPFEYAGPEVRHEMQMILEREFKKS